MPKLLEDRIWVEIHQEGNDTLSIVKEGCRLRHDGYSLQLKRKKHFN